jgi:hypothetical protein
MAGRLTDWMANARQHALEGGQPVARQVLEAVLLRVVRGMGPNYYQMGGFWRRDISWQQKFGHLNVAEYKRALRHLNPDAYRKLSQHKVAEKAILSLFDIPTPRFLGLVVGADTAATDHVPHRLLRHDRDLRALIEHERPARLVFKDVEGSGGKGVLIAAVDLHAPQPTLRQLDQPHALSVEQFFATSLCRGKRASEWLIEEYLAQHPVLSGLHAGSVNTVRIWVRKTEAGPRVLTAYLRIGRGSMYVDNASSGGIVAPIDLATGTLRPAQDASPRRCLYVQHPDSGAPIEGLQLPFWPEVQSLACAALARFPRLRFAGLDIATSVDGPSVIELNVCPDREGACFTGFRSVELLKP